MTTTTSNTAFIWPTLIYDDARAAIEFLQEAFGFTVSMIVSNETDQNVVEHAQLRWPEGGGVMLGSAGRPGNAFSERPTGCGSVYVVTSAPDDAHARAVDAGASIFRALEDEAYGNRSFSVTDPEGNLWTFGSYEGES